MIARRSLLAAAGALAAAPLVRGTASAATAIATLGEDGMWHEDWFIASFLDLPDDLQAASAAGHRLAVMWELPGCPFCRLTHQVSLADPKVLGFVRDRFDIVQLDLVGALEVTYPDGVRLAEKAQAARQHVVGSPVFQFFAGPGETTPAGTEVARFSGYLPPDRFLTAFCFVADRGYEHGSLQQRLQASG